jgi:hypothetical protein
MRLITPLTLPFVTALALLLVVLLRTIFECDATGEDMDGGVGCCTTGAVEVGDTLLVTGVGARVGNGGEEDASAATSAGDGVYSTSLHKGNQNNDGA